MPMVGIEIVTAYSEAKHWIPYHAVLSVVQVNQSDGVRATIWLIDGTKLTTKTSYETIVAMLEDSNG